MINRLLSLIFLIIFLSCLREAKAGPDFPKPSLDEALKSILSGKLNQKPCATDLSAGLGLTLFPVNSAASLDATLTQLKLRAEKAASLKLNPGKLATLLREIRAYVEKRPSRFFKNRLEEDLRISEVPAHLKTHEHQSLPASIFSDEAAFTILAILPPKYLENYTDDDMTNPRLLHQKVSADLNHLLSNPVESNSVLNPRGEFSPVALNILADHMLFLNAFHARASRYSDFVTPFNVLLNRILTMSFVYQSLHMTDKIYQEKQKRSDAKLSEIYPMNREEILELLNSLIFVINTLDKNPKLFEMTGFPENMSVSFIGAAANTYLFVLLESKDELRPGDYRDMERKILNLESLIKNALKAVLPDQFKEAAGVDETLSTTEVTTDSTTNPPTLSAGQVEIGATQQPPEPLSMANLNETRREEKAKKLPNRETKTPRKAGSPGRETFQQMIDKMKQGAASNPSVQESSGTSIKTIVFKNPRIEKDIEAFKTQNSHRKRGYEKYRSWRAMVEKYGWGQAQFMPGYPRDVVLEGDKSAGRGHRIRLNNAGDRLIYTIDESKRMLIIEEIVFSHDYGKK